MWEERKKKKINFGNLLLYSLCLSVRPSVRPSVCPHGTIRFPLEKFPWKLIFENFSKIYRENQVILKYNKNKGYFTWWHMYIYDNISLNYSKNEKLFRKSRRDNQNIHFVSNNFFSPKIVPFMRKCEKIRYRQTDHRRQHKMAQKRWDMRKE